jgi:hypothetical protein
MLNGDLAFDVSTDSAEDSMSLFYLLAAATRAWSIELEFLL